MSDTNKVKLTEYWEAYYGKIRSECAPIPSQFAPFALQEAENPELIIEFGCGIGRDSFFFAHQGIRTVGIDGSHVAIEKCQEITENFKIGGVDFECCRIGRESLERVTLKHIPRDRNFKIMVYARFFLHAITEEDEDLLIDYISEFTKCGDTFAIEYRTIRDSNLKKTTDTHFRRFVNPVMLYDKLIRSNFLIEYAVEGFGFAKYRADDAYAARCIAVRK